jgi:serine O-acetyltransferase
VGNGVLLGAGATVLGPVSVGEGSQLGAGTLATSDIPPHSVAVGVPARLMGNFGDTLEQPSVEMDQIVDERSSRMQTLLRMDGI